MAKTSAIITYTDANGKAMQKTLTDINPDASSAEIKTFAQKMVGMTDNVYVQTDRVDKINCDTEASKPVKADPTLTLSANTLNCSSLTDASWQKVAQITTNSDSTIYVRFSSYIAPVKEYGVNSLLKAGIGHDDQTNEGTFLYLHNKWNNWDIMSWPQTIYVGVAETDNFKAKEVPFTITAD